VENLEQHDVIIVGGGPVGSRVAHKLAQSGLEVIVMEKQFSPGNPVCCTGLISHECITQFSIDPDLILHEFSKATIFSPSGTAINVERPSVQAYAINRSALNQRMSRKAVESGAEYRAGYKVVSLDVRADRVVAEVENSGGSINYEARAVVLATGFGSRLHGTWGKPGDWAMGVQAEVEMAADELEIYLGRDFAPGFFAWLVPLDGSRGLAGLIARRDVKRHFNHFIAHLRRQGKIKSPGNRPFFRGITLKPPHQTFGQRLLVVGDAAGQVKPITGGGVYFGLLCADIAADCLKSALNLNDLSPKRLSDYQRQWHNLLGQELKTAYFARKIFESMSDNFIERLCSMRRVDGILAQLAQNQSIGFDWHGQAIKRAARQFLLNC
jgi:digeranylgeranylglycerophospholipid reductase